MYIIPFKQAANTVSLLNVAQTGKLLIIYELYENITFTLIIRGSPLHKLCSVSNEVDTVIRNTMVIYIL